MRPATLQWQWAYVKLFPFQLVSRCPLDRIRRHLDHCPKGSFEVRLGGTALRVQGALAGRALQKCMGTSCSEGAA